MPAGTGDGIGGSLFWVEGVEGVFWIAENGGAAGDFGEANAKGFCDVALRFVF